MKPPVEAPTSRQSRPVDVDAERVERVLELEPAARDEAPAVLDVELGRRRRPAGSASSARSPPRPTRTRPARIDAAAAVRDGEAALGEQGVEPLAGIT